MFLDALSAVHSARHYAQTVTVLTQFGGFIRECAAHKDHNQDQ